MIFDVSAISNGMDATSLLGEQDFTTINNIAAKNFPPSQRQMLGGRGVAYDGASNRAFVADEAHRVLLFDEP
jgi:hypothetical protein